MMEHIEQIDWYSHADNYQFVNESDLDHCVTERILRNKFYDPLMSSDDEDSNKVEINWDQVLLKRKKTEKLHQVYVPCLGGMPQHPKLSRLTSLQHYQCLKVICAKNPNILKGHYIGKPSKQDCDLFEDIQQIYKEEQKEYIEWAKTQWANGHCLRALRPKPAIETVYEAKYKLQETELQSFPKQYETAAQISLDGGDNDYELIHQEDLISVSLKRVPIMELPDLSSKYSVNMTCPISEPCTKHPCRFVLPGESAMTVLPLTEIHQQLAQFAQEHGARYIVSASALQCLLDVERPWVLPLSVCEVIDADGAPVTVAVLHGPAAARRGAGGAVGAGGPGGARVRSAYRTLLYHQLVPESELKKLVNNIREDEKRNQNTKAKKPSQPVNNFFGSDGDDDDDDDEDGIGQLFIDAGDEETPMDTGESDNSDSKVNNNGKPDKYLTRQQKRILEDNNNEKKTDESGNEFYNCACKGTIFERPPLRSYRKWQVRNKTTSESFSMIVHYAHKARTRNGEVLLEASPEYQLDLGASARTEGGQAGLTLALALRKNTTLLNVRLDASTGEVVTLERASRRELTETAERALHAAAGATHAALAPLAGLLPARYLLTHEVSHGKNALLLAPSPSGSFVLGGASETDTAAELATPPALAPVLLPHHKFRKILPLAFTPFQHQVAKEQKSNKPPPRQKTPPKAIKWPKKKGRKRKKPNAQAQ